MIIFFLVNQWGSKRNLIFYGKSIPTKLNKAEEVEEWLVAKVFSKWRIRINKYTDVAIMHKVGDHGIIVEFNNRRNDGPYWKLRNLTKNVDYNKNLHLKVRIIIHT